MREETYNLDRARIKIGDWGWKLVLDMVDPAIDTSTATSCEILYTKPDGSTKGAWPAQPSPDSKTSIYRIMDGSEFDQEGTWEVRARITGADYRLTGDPQTVAVISAE